MKYCFQLLMCASVALSLGNAQPAPRFWLDAPPAGWNHPGAPVPPAPKETVPRECRKEIRAAKTAEEKMLESAGWHIPSFDVQEQKKPLLILKAMASADGMCRPDSLQTFVFVNGIFAGTLAPAPMEARADGVISSSTVAGPHSIRAEFQRYDERDPLCCPSRLTRATFEIQQQNGKPVVIFTGAVTHHNPQ